MQISLHLRPPALGQETLPPPSSQSPGPGEYCITLEEHIQLLMFCLMSSPSLSWSLVFATTSVTREQKISMSNQLWGSFLTKQSWDILKFQLSELTSHTLLPGRVFPLTKWPVRVTVSLILTLKNQVWLFFDEVHVENSNMLPFKSSTAWVQSSILPLTGCVALTKLLRICKRIILVLSSLWVMGIKWCNLCKMLGTL